MKRPHALARLGLMVALGIAPVVACGVTRDAAYFQLLGHFGKAQSRDAETQGASTPSWRFEVPLAGVTATVEGRKGMDAIRVQYSDEAQPRTLYEYVDYSNPIDVRVDGTSLYVYWSETLLGSSSYVLSYDLQHRQLLAKRRVDPKDVQQK